MPCTSFCSLSAAHRRGIGAATRAPAAVSHGTLQRGTRGGDAAGTRRRRGGDAAATRRQRTPRSLSFGRRRAPRSCIARACRSHPRAVYHGSVRRAPSSPASGTAWFCTARHGTARPHHEGRLRCSASDESFTVQVACRMSDVVRGVLCAVPLGRSPCTDRLWPIGRQTPRRLKVYFPGFERRRNLQ